MKGLILCAGKGTRMRPFTYSGAKHLLPAANKPVVHYIIEALMDAGIRDIAIIVGDGEEEFKDKVGDGGKWGVSITYIRQDRPLGLADAIARARDYVCNCPFIAVLGDNLIMQPFKNIIDYFLKTGADCTILLSKVDRPERYGIASVRDGRVAGVIEKPKDSIGNLGVVGLYVFTPKIFDAIGQIEPSGRGELEISDAITDLIRRGHLVNYVYSSGWWKDIGRPEDLLEANRKVLEHLDASIKGQCDSKSNISGQIYLGSGSRIINCTVSGPVVIGDDVMVSDTIIGPYTSIGDRSSITGCRIENSIILEKCLLQNIINKIDASIIGSGSVIREREISGSLAIWVDKDSRIEIS
ncbi:MAG: Glucose-1-phosphate thymidylyltransferase [Firmicutes bacterium]|nr:Glucose-1-phosphate thymidylyltransferase [Bacillota bacterium]MDI6705309.1 glucose-1-phosphate thymidylyltransferase [Bacillota bacterium]